MFDALRRDPPAPTLCRLRRGESGQSLIEVLMAALLSVIVLGSVGMLLITGERQQQKSVNYDFAQQGAQWEIDQMVAQIRSAYNIVSWGGNAVDFDVNLGNSPYQVYIECDVTAGNGWNKCVRLQLPVTSPVPTSLTGATTLIPHISNGTTTSPVFAWSTVAPQSAIPTSTTSTTTTTLTSASVTPVAPDYVTATVDVPASDGVTAQTLSLARTVAYSDGALIRNVDIQN